MNMAERNVYVEIEKITVYSKKKKKILVKLCRVKRRERFFAVNACVFTGYLPTLLIVVSISLARRWRRCGLELTNMAASVFFINWFYVVHDIAIINVSFFFFRFLYLYYSIKICKNNR